MFKGKKMQSSEAHFERQSSRKGAVLFKTSFLQDKVAVNLQTDDKLGFKPRGKEKKKKMFCFF